MQHPLTDQFDSLKLQIERDPYPFPKLEIINKYDNINNYRATDFQIKDYKYHESIKMVMRK